MLRPFDHFPRSIQSLRLIADPSKAAEFSLVFIKDGASLPVTDALLPFARDNIALCRLEDAGHIMSLSKLLCLGLLHNYFGGGRGCGDW